VMSSAQAESLLAHLWEIERVDDVRQVMPMMTGRL